MQQTDKCNVCFLEKLISLCDLDSDFYSEAK